ncbi:TPA: phage minor capsid protein [Streptococcus pneumoniae]
MAYDVSKAFERIENDLLDSMIRNLGRHKAEETAEGFEWEQWQVAQLKELERFKRANAKKYSKEFANINSKISTAIQEAYRQGMDDEEMSILEAIKNGFEFNSGKDNLGASFFAINERKLNALLNSIEHDMKTAEHAVLRYTDDQYRRTIFDAQVAANTGAKTYEQSVDMATKDFLSRGITSIQYSNGAMVNIVSYADMAIRTATKRAYLMGEGVKRQEWGIHTVILNKRSNACPLCMPFEGKVLIDDVWSGGSADDGPYPLLSSAMAAGLYHPNCKDKHTTYFPGISSEPEKIFTNQELDDIKERQLLDNKVQYAKRQEKRFSRLSQFSLDEDNVQKYTLRAEEWSKLKSNAEENLKYFEAEKGYKLYQEFSLESDSDYKKFINRQRLPRDTSGVASKKIAAETRHTYIDATRKKFKDGTELGQDLFARLADQSAIATIAETGVVRYESGKLFLNMYKDVDDPRGPGTGYFHEFGHQIDEKLGWEFTKDKKILQLLRKDFINLSDETIFEAIHINDKASSASDILGALSEGRIQGKYSHSLVYWEKKGNIESEFFAHVFEAQFDDERREILEKTFPESYNYVINKLKER